MESIEAEILEFKLNYQTKEYLMSKNNTSANLPEQKVRQQGQNKPEITELSFEAMETISGGAGKVKWSLN